MADGDDQDNFVKDFLNYAWLDWSLIIFSIMVISYSVFVSMKLKRYKVKNDFISIIKKYLSINWLI